MSVSEHDLEIIESWLDGEISQDQVEALRARISSDPHLSQTVDRLRSERALRASIWQTMEPSEKQAELLVGNIRRAVRKEDLIDGRLRALRKFASMAAMVALVFGAGWITHSRVGFAQNQQIVKFPGNPTQLPAAEQPLVSAQPHGSAVTVLSGNTNQRPTNNGSFVLSQYQGDGLGAAPTDRRLSTLLPRYHATITSPMGNVYDYQLDKLSDLAELQQRVEQDELNARQKPLTPQVGPRNRGNETVPVSDSVPLNPNAR